MHRFFRSVSPGFIVLMLIVSTISSGFAETGNAPHKHGAHKGSLIITNTKISAEFEDLSLGEILTEIKDQNNIWFKGNESILNKKISVSFTDLSLEDGIKRILRSANYVIVYHNDGVLAGVILLDKSSQENEMAKTSPGLTKSSSFQLSRKDNEEDPSSQEQSYERPMEHDPFPEIHVVKKSVITPIVPAKIKPGISTLKSGKGNSTSFLGRSHHMENFKRTICRDYPD